MPILSLLASAWASKKISDIAVRIAVASLLLGVLAVARKAWITMSAPGFVNHFRGTVYVTVVYVVVFWVLGTMIMPLILGRSGRRAGQEAVSKAGVGLIVWTIKLILGSVVNVAVLIMQLAFSVVTPGRAADRVVDALSHYMERTGDLLTGH